MHFWGNRHKNEVTICNHSESRIKKIRKECSAQCWGCKIERWQRVTVVLKQFQAAASKRDVAQFRSFPNSTVCTLTDTLQCKRRNSLPRPTSSPAKKLWTLTQMIATWKVFAFGVQIASLTTWIDKTFRTSSFQVWKHEKFCHNCRWFLHFTAWLLHGPEVVLPLMEPAQDCALSPATTKHSWHF